MIPREAGATGVTEYNLRGAYSHRITLMLEALIRRNRELWEIDYQNHLRVDPRDYKGRSFVQNAYTLNTLTDDMVDRLASIKNALTIRNETSVEDLEEMDGRLGNTLEEMEVPIALPKLTELTATWNKADRGSNIVVFKAKMKEIALERINANARGLDELQEQYRMALNEGDDHLGEESCYIRIELLEAILKDRELERRIKFIQGELHGKEWTYSMSNAYSSGYYGIAESGINEELMGEISELRALLEEVGQIRNLLHMVYPVVSLLETDEIAAEEGATQRDIYRLIVIAFEKAREAQAEVKQKIRNDDMPLYKLDPVVFAALEFYGITENSTDQFARDVLDWLKRKRRGESFIKIGSAVACLGLFLACFIPGIGVGAIIALGAVGAGVGGASSIYEFEMADDLNDAGKSQAAGQYKLITDPAAAKKEYIWGIVNLCLAGLDAYMAGSEVLKIGKLVKSFSSTAEGFRVINQMESLDDAANFFKRLDEAGICPEIMRMLESISDDALRALPGLTDKGLDAIKRTDDWDSVLRMLSEADDPKLIVQYINDADFILESGTKGSWNKVMNGNLEPDSNYLIDGRYMYSTDGAGRVTQVTGQLEFHDRGRNIYQQGKSVKIKDGVQGEDDGGHLIAQIFNGPGEQINYLPQNSSLNRGDWRMMESEWADAIREGQKVDVDIQMLYNEGRKRPDLFQVFFSLDNGMPQFREFINH